MTQQQSPPTPGEVPLTREAQANFLQTEAGRYDSSMRQALTQVYQYGALAFGLLGAAGPLLADKGRYEVLVVLPPLAILIWLMGLRVMNELFALAAYKDYLEHKLARTVNVDRKGEQTLYVTWSAVAGPRMNSAPIGIAVFGGFVVLSLSIGVGSFAVALDHISDNKAWVVADIVVCVIFALVAAASAIPVLGNYDAVKERLLMSEEMELGGTTWNAATDEVEKLDRGKTPHAPAWKRIWAKLHL